jgi:hypothetical protein
MSDTLDVTQMGERSARTCLEKRMCATGAMPMGAPGWPLLDFATTSAARMRIVLIARSSESCLTKDMLTMTVGREGSSELKSVSNRELLSIYFPRSACLLVGLPHLTWRIIFPSPSPTKAVYNGKHNRQRSARNPWAESTGASMADPLIHPATDNSSSISSRR